MRRQTTLPALALPALLLAACFEGSVDAAATAEIDTVVTEDELDVPYVARLRIERGG